MDQPQSLTEKDKPTPPRGVTLSTIKNMNMLSPQQLAWVDYCLLQGLITDDDGVTHKMSISEFARTIDVPRETLHYWKREMPMFWDFVAQRRKEVFGRSRTAKVYNSLYIAAVKKLDVRAMQTWLANADDNFRMPAQPVVVEAGNSWAALLNKRRNQSTIQEGEVIDGDKTTS